MGFARHGIGTSISIPPDRRERMHLRPVLTITGYQANNSNDGGAKSSNQG
jgi:hypothetical protein